jgi:protein-tyrosine phosphatase
MEMTSTSAVRAKSLLEGANNFRDFGGFLGAGGWRVRRGMLFRSNKLSVLTPEDCAKLDALGIAAVFDLRLEGERLADPTCWSREGCEVHTFQPGRKRRLVDMALEYPPTEAGVLSLMQDFYAKMPHTMGHVFGAIIRRLAAGDVPCIIHCAAGKDRTGVSCALVLAALGVGREDIVADYVRTGTYRERFPQGDAERAKVVTGAITDLGGYPPQAIELIRTAAASYIEAALDSAEARYGSLEGYLAEGLGLESHVIDALRARLLGESA